MSDSKSTTTAKVGDNVSSQCGACKKLTSHTVLSMGAKRPLRVRCKACDRDHNYRPPSKVSGNRPLKKDPDVTQWEKLATGWKAAKAMPYAMDKSFARGDLINHPQFGLGQVQLINRTNRMRVLFQAGVKTMVCATGR